jgi:hypothetical protein
MASTLATVIALPLAGISAIIITILESTFTEVIPANLAGIPAAIAPMVSGSRVVLLAPLHLTL